MDACEICKLEGLADCKYCHLANPCLGCELEGNCHGECYKEEIVDKLIDIPN